MPRKPLADDMFQTSFRLPRALYDRLRQEPGGFPEAVRRRLEASLLRDDAADRQTQALAEAVASLARNVRPYYGEWHENPYAFAVFKIALDSVLSKMRPKGEPIAPEQADEWRPGDTPEQAGVALGTAEIVARGL